MVRVYRAWTKNFGIDSRTGLSHQRSEKRKDFWCPRGKSFREWAPLGWAPSAGSTLFWDAIANLRVSCFGSKITRHGKC